MPFVARLPRPPLSAFVRVVWHATSDEARGFEWVLPSGDCQLVIQLEDRPNRWSDPRGRARHIDAAAIGGPFLEPVGLHQRDIRAVAGALFEPGGLAALVGHPVRVLQGHYVALDDLLDAGAWIDRVRTASSAEEALDRLESGLAGHLRRRSRRRALERACAALADGLSVREVAERLGASQRRFSRTFTDETGLTPKQYTRLRRFQRALVALRRGAEGDLATLALRCGYWDQAHLNHEFQAFASLTPTTILEDQSPFTNHVRVRTSDGHDNPR